MVPADEVCLLPVSEKLGSPSTFHLLDTHQVVPLRGQASLEGYVLIVYYGQVTQP